MKRAFKSLTAVALLVLILTNCSARKQQVTTSSSSERNQQVTAFKNVNLVPMADERIVENQTVLVKGTRILEIGPSSEIDIPENAAVIDGAGAYLMPGLADMHMHTSDDWMDWPVSPLNLFLANGVTTIRSFGPTGEFSKYVLDWRNEINEWRRIGPTIYACGPILYGPVDDPQKTVREQKAQGFDFIKLYSYLSKEEFHKAMTAAKELDIYTSGHIPFSVGLDGVLSEGMNEIAHIEELAFEFVEFDRNKDLKGRKWIQYVIKAAVQQSRDLFSADIKALEKRFAENILDVANKLKSANIPVCTTLVVDDVLVKKLFEPKVFLARPENNYLPRWYMSLFRQRKEKHQVQFKGIEDLAPFKYAVDRLLLTGLHRAEVTLVLGTDAGTGGMGIVPGFSIHDELRILTENGFTPYEAITTATVNASKVAQAMTGKDEFGTVEVGKRADLILVNKNPLDDIANIRDLRGVMASGRWYEKAKLEKIISN